MAVTTITPTDLVRGTAAVITPGAGTAINTANTMAIAYPKDGKLLVLIDSDHASTVGTFAAGTGVAAGKGALAVAVDNTVQSMVIVDSDRHKDADGNVSISWAASSAGFVRAFYLPE